MKNYVNSGDVVTISAPIVLTSGQFLSVGLLRGFAQTDADLYADVALVTRGVFSATVSAPDGEVVVGQPVYVIDGTTLTTVAPEGTAAWEYAGLAVTAALAQDGVATVNIRLI